MLTYDIHIKKKILSIADSRLDGSKIIKFSRKIKNVLLKLKFVIIIEEKSRRAFSL